MQQIFKLASLLTISFVFLSGAAYGDLPTSAVRAKAFDEYISVIKRVDGDGLLPRKNRPQSWDKTVSTLKKEFVNATNEFQMGQVLKRVDQSYTNIHSSAALAPDYDFHQKEGRVITAVRFAPEEVNENQKQFKYRVKVQSDTLLLILDPEDRPKDGDELLKINDRSMKSWSEENFLFCKYPLREQCEIGFWDSFRKELLTWNRRVPLFMTLKRGNKIWKIPVPIRGQDTNSTTSKTNEEKSDPCGVEPGTYMDFKLVYEGRNACAYEDSKQDGIVILRITSFNYRKETESKIKNITEETDLFWVKYWKSKAPKTKKIIIDVTDNDGGDTVVGWYNLLFQKPYQEQYVQFRKFNEFDRADIQGALFYHQASKQMTLDNLKKDPGWPKIKTGDFIAPMPGFCADDNKDCRDGLFQPKSHGFKGDIRVVLNQWCHSSCVGFVRNLNNVLEQRVKFIGQPDNGDSTYGRIFIDLTFDKSLPNGFKIELNPREGGVYATTTKDATLRQAVSVSRSTDSKGNVISGIPQKVNYWIPYRWDQGWNAWQTKAVQAALQN
jgi:hypothetical protein